MAKVAKELEITGRHIHKPESRQCNGCGGAIELQDYYQWRKTVQHLRLLQRNNYPERVWG